MHTPGPWTAVDNKGHQWQYAVRGSDGELIAACSRRDDESEVRANAKVLAAAPDLLAALQIVVAALEGKPCRQLALDDARAAIEKATSV